MVDQLLTKYKKFFIIGLGVLLVIILIASFVNTTSKGIGYNNQVPTYTVTPTQSIAPVTIDTDPFYSNISINNSYYFGRLSYNIAQTQAQLNAYDANPITGDYLAHKLGLSTFQDPSGLTGWKNAQYLLSFYDNQYHLHNLASSYKGGIVISKDMANTIASSQITQLLSLASGSFTTNITTHSNQFVVDVTLVFNGYSAYAQTISSDITVTLNGNGELSDIVFAPFPLSTTLTGSYRILSIQDAVNQSINGSIYLSLNGDISASQTGIDNVQLTNINIISSSLGYTYTFEHPSLVPAYIFIGKASSPTISGGAPFAMKAIIPAVAGANLNIITPTPTPSGYNNPQDNDNIGKQ